MKLCLEKKWTAEKKDSPGVGTHRNQKGLLGTCQALRGSWGELQLEGRVRQGQVKESHVCHRKDRVSHGQEGAEWWRACV